MHVPCTRRSHPPLWKSYKLWIIIILTYSFSLIILHISSLLFIFLHLVIVGGAISQPLASSPITQQLWTSKCKHMRPPIHVKTTTASFLDCCLCYITVKHARRKALSSLKFTDVHDWSALDRLTGKRVKPSHFYQWPILLSTTPRQGWAQMLFCWATHEAWCQASFWEIYHRFLTIGIDTIWYQTEGNWYF